MREFDGKVAVVTGAASGMGKAFAEKFAQQGMKVVLADVEEKALDAAITEFRQKEYASIGVVTDVTSASAIQALADRTIAEYGKVHIICNNAGVADEKLDRPVWEVDLADWQWTFNVNWWGVVNGIRTFMPLLLEHGEPAHMLNTASIAGLINAPTLPIYSITKHAVVQVSETIHQQLQARDANTNVGVSVLCPGLVDTKIFHSARNRPDVDEATREEWRARGTVSDSPSPFGGDWGPMTDIMKPAQVAEIVFQAIQDNQFYITPHGVTEEVLRGRVENIIAHRAPAQPQLR